MTPGSDVDLLTRTTLHVDGIMPGASVGQMIRALQRVPGVLLADVTAADARAIVAHDAAVPVTSLIAAAENAGVRVKIISETRLPMLTGNSAALLNSLGNRQLLVVAAAASFIVVGAVLLMPNAAQRHGIVIVLTLSLWAFYVAKSFMGHRRS